jgi:hypothetical protein
MNVIFARINKRSLKMMINLRVILPCILILIFLKPALGQDSALVTEDTISSGASVSWVRDYSSAGKDHANKGFGDKLVEFIFGKKNTPRLTRPVAVMAGKPEGAWVLDQENGVIFRFREEVGEITHLKNKQYGNFKSLVGICSIPGDRILFTDSYWNKVFVFAAGKKEVMPFMDSIAFDRPTGLACSGSNGDIWVVETNAHRIAVLGADGTLKKRFGRRGTGPGEFNYPTSIWIDRSGKVFIVDAMNFRVQIFDGEGNFIAMFGKIGDVTGSFARPKGIATDSYGHVYVADALFNAVQIFDQSGRFLYTFGTQGHGSGEFWMPSGLFIDDQDNIYVADSYNARVQVFKLNYGSH